MRTSKARLPPDPARTLKALADPTRLRIIRLLLERDLCVCELIFILEMEQSRLSHQLKILREAGLVEDLREGRWMNYRIVPAWKSRLGTLLEAVQSGGRGENRPGREDFSRVALCLEEDIRGRRCSRPQSPPDPPGVSRTGSPGRSRN